MTYEKLYRLVDDLNCKVTLKKMEQYKVGTICTYPLYEYEILRNKHESIARHIIMMLTRCITVRNKFEVIGNIEVVCFCSRPMLIGRADHIRNFRKVTDMLKNKVLMFGTAMEGFTFKNLGAIFLPFVWNHELKRVLKDKTLRWGYIRNLYGAYIDFLEYRRFEEKHKLAPKGLLLLEEEIPSAKLMKQYYDKCGRTTVVLQHGVYDGRSQLSKYYFDHWGCDYMLTYSQYSLEQLDEMGGYPGQTRILGMFQYIGESVRERKIKSIRKMGVFLNGTKGEYETELKMINVVADVAKDFNAEIYVKLHPSSQSDDLEFFKRHTKHLGIKKYFCDEISSMELEQEIDVFVCRNTTCFLEAVYQMIPAFVFNYEPVVYRNIKENVLFRSKEELKELCESAIGDNAEKRLQKIKRYICGCENPEKSYQKFFKELGWI